MTALLPATRAQQAVIPLQANTGTGQATNQRVLFGNASLGWRGLRVQMLYAAREIPAGPRVIRALRLRQDTGPVRNHAVTVQATIRMSNSPHDPALATDSYAANHGPDLTTVFSGTISMPARPPATTWPTPFEAPIVLQTPFTYSGNSSGSLVVDIATTGNDSSGSWKIEAWDVDDGETDSDHVQSGCESSTGSVALGYVNLSHLVPGGHFRVGFSPYPSREPLLDQSVIVLGAQGSGTGFQPFPLSAFGVAASPGCRWATDVHLVVPATYYQPPPAVTHPSLGQVGMPNTIPIPNDAGLVGAVFYSQALSVDRDPQTGTPRLLASLSLRHRIGNGQGPAAAMVTSLDHTATTGSVHLGRVGTLGLE